MKTILLSLFVALGLAQSATISTITCSGQAVTVNATAHGIVQYQGFSITGSSVSTYNLNGTAATATTNAFTFTQPAGTSCNGSATGGTVTAAKQIINVSSTAAGNAITINALFWNTTIVPVPLACPIPTGGTQPVCPTSAWSGASAAENAAIVAGTTIESPQAFSFNSSTSPLTLSNQIAASFNAIQSSYSSGFLGYAGYWWAGGLSGGNPVWVNH